MPVPALMLGLELSRLTADRADTLGTSLSVIEAGGWALSVYEGPAFQPVAGAWFGPLEIALMPALATRRDVATSADGREGTVVVVQGRLGLRVLAANGPVRLGVEGSISSGRATLDGDLVASGTPMIALGPALGLALPVTETWSVLARATYPFALSEGSFSSSLEGALALEWCMATRP